MGDVVLIFDVVLLVGSLFYMIKNEITIHHYMMIDAICLYRIESIDMGNVPVVDFSDMESYHKTMLRFWDFRTETILPEGNYEIIKPYIDRFKH